VSLPLYRLGRNLTYIMFHFGAQIRAASPQEYIIHPLSYSLNHKGKYLDLNFVMPSCLHFQFMWLPLSLCFTLCPPPNPIRITPISPHISTAFCTVIRPNLKCAVQVCPASLTPHSPPSTTENVYLWIRAANSVTSSRYSIT
jgi:hypothetical protein